MKKIIYLPLLILIGLCSCKSNSFTKQRYTHFSNNSGKHAIAKKTSNRSDKVVVENDETTIEPSEPGYVETASASKTNPVLIVKENLFDPLKTKISEANIALLNEQAQTFEHSKTVFKNKKSETNKNNTKKIIGTVLKIVLWVVILAVVLGLIILVTLLG
ncbi:MAG: hypothetical protein JNJ40_00425 [Bacteroidia bacterium]|nr:hypothetical protein [Bacteroidia bacterium]